jgi:hypothetical protein
MTYGIQDQAGHQIGKDRLLSDLFILFTSKMAARSAFKLTPHFAANFYRNYSSCLFEFVDTKFLSRKHYTSHMDK